MTKVQITTRESEQLTVEGGGTQTLMEVIRENGVDELLALCGGQLSCATCHVYIDPAFVDRIPPMSEFENDLLSSSDHRTAVSRLSCQIDCTPNLDGIKIVVAPKN
jgi:2Fe-2S ferredoxin